MPGDDLDRVLDPDYLADLDELTSAELRARRGDCEGFEEAVSYARRLLQGRLDILRAELVRREEAGDEAARSVLDDLSAILSRDATRTDPLQARATRLRVPPGAERFEAKLDAIVDEAELARLDGQRVEYLERLVEQLAAEERRLSDLRRKLFDRIDTLRDELARRYKDGRADVSEILG